MNEGQGRAKVYHVANYSLSQFEPMEYIRSASARMLYVVNILFKTINNNNTTFI